MYQTNVKVFDGFWESYMGYFLFIILFKKKTIFTNIFHFS